MIHSVLLSTTAEHVVFCAEDLLIVYLPPPSEDHNFKTRVYKINAMARRLILTEYLQAVLKTHQCTYIFLVFLPDVFELHMTLPHH